MILLWKYLAEVNWYTFYAGYNDLGLGYEYIDIGIIRILCTCEHTLKFYIDIEFWIFKLEDT